MFKIHINFIIDYSVSQIQQLEADMRPLKDSIQSLTTQKDALLAEKTALKNEVPSKLSAIYVLSLTVVKSASVTCEKVT